jgi:hypothetical protein
MCLYYWLDGARRRFYLVIHYPRQKVLWCKFYGKPHCTITVRYTNCINSAFALDQEKKMKNLIEL